MGIESKIRNLEQDLFYTDSFSTFESLLMSEALLDTMCTHLERTQEGLLESYRKVSTIISPVVGDNSWKDGITDAMRSEPSVERVVEKASTTVLKLELRGQPLLLGHGLVRRRLLWLLT